MTLPTLSQETTIDPQRKTIELDSAQAVSVAKTIKNEERLERRVRFLNRQIRKLNDSVQSYVKANENYLGTIQGLHNQIEYQAKALKEAENRGRQVHYVNTTSVSKAPRGYAYFGAGTDLRGLTTLDIGLALSFEKTLYTLSIDPIIGEKPVFRVGIGLKIF